MIWSIQHTENMQQSPWDALPKKLVNRKNIGFVPSFYAVYKKNFVGVTNK